MSANIPQPEPIVEHRPGVWIKASWLRFYGVTLQTRMVVLELSGGGLLRSLPPSPPRGTSVEELGQMGS